MAEHITLLGFVNELCLNDTEARKVGSSVIFFTYLSRSRPCINEVDDHTDLII
jgi:hypothetical protein